MGSTGLNVSGRTYTYSDPGLVFDLYTSSPSSYIIPGPAVWSGSAGGSIAQVGTTGTVPKSGTVPKYGQCGGIGWTVCQFINRSTIPKLMQ